MRRVVLLFSGVVLATGCERRDRFSAPDTTSAPPVATLPPRSAYLTISDLSPKPGATVVVGGRVNVGPDFSLGSYRVRLGYDSTLVHFVDEIPSPGMMRVVNPQPGDVIVVGAASAPSPDGTLFTLRLRVDEPSAINSLVLRVDELNDASFTNQKETVTRASRLILDRRLGQPLDSSQAITRPGASAVTAATPVIDSVSPRSGSVESERVTDLTLYGSGFSPRGNDVVFGGRVVPGLASDANGTVIRLPAPAIRVPEGPVRIRVRNSGGESNAVTFTVKEGDR